jgi:amino acid transporter
MGTRDGSGQLRSGALSTWNIVFLVVATAAPLTAMVTAMPVAVALGNGAGTVGTYVVVALVLTMFAVGYAAMSGHITNAGAFFAYIAAGLGRRAGMAAGLVALVAYNLLAVYVAALVGFFAAQTLDSELSIHIAWWILSLAGLAIAFGLGVAGVELNARVLATLLIAETALLLLVDGAILVDHGTKALPTTAIDPSTVFSGSVGIAFMFAFTSFIGFEATAIFGEEAKDPKRSVPRATIAAIAFIGVVYFVSSWLIVGANGGAGAQAVAAKDPGTFVFAAGAGSLGAWSTHAMSWLLLTSLLAVLIAIHGMATRYVFTFGRERVLPAALGRTHPQRQTPHIAGCVQAVVVILFVAVYAIAGADPYLDLGSQMAGVGALGVIALMGFTSIAVIPYFARRADRRLWPHVIAPSLAAAGLFAACYLIIDNYSLLTGSTSSVVNNLPWVLLIAAVVGAVVGGRPSGEPLDEQQPAVMAEAR